MLRRLFDKAGQLCLGIGRRISPIPMESRTIPWFRNKGDSVHRQQYDLDASSTVFDLGGYEGQWASDIHSRYCCTIHVFEPVQAYADNIQRRFAKNAQIQVHPFGLGSATTEVTIGLSSDGSSAFKSADKTVQGRIVGVAEFLAQNSLSQIDLMKINIEGGEYDLLDYLVEIGLTPQIKDIQIQFHDFVPSAEARMKAIQSRLSQTHTLTYQYEFVWENWTRKVSQPQEAQ